MDLVNKMVINSDPFPYNNFIIYQSPVSQRWAPIAHDFDNAFFYGSAPNDILKPFLRQDCTTYKKFMDIWFPILKEQLPIRFDVLAQIVNSSISHPVVLHDLLDFKKELMDFEERLQNMLNVHKN